MEWSADLPQSTARPEKIALDPDMIEVRDPRRWGCLVGQVEQALTYRSKANESNMLTVSRNFACKIMHVLSAYCTDQYFLFCAYGMLMRRYRNKVTDSHYIRSPWDWISPSIRHPCQRWGLVHSGAGEQELFGHGCSANRRKISGGCHGSSKITSPCDWKKDCPAALLENLVVNRFYCRINAALWIWSEILNSS